MNSTINKPSKKPIKVNVTRMEQIFENTNPHKHVEQTIIKEYIYTPQKRVIA